MGARLLLPIMLYKFKHYGTKYPVMFCLIKTVEDMSDSVNEIPFMKKFQKEKERTGRGQGLTCCSKGEDGVRK